jgi:hypothetical protein
MGSSGRELRHLVRDREMARADAHSDCDEFVILPFNGHRYVLPD